MSKRGNEKKEKYLMDRRILSILKRAPKRGIWMKELARRLNIPRPLLNYYLFGIKKGNVIIGGRFRYGIYIRKEGNNKFVLIRGESTGN
jgi:DNA-binding Lrp family transcriptional regulator